MGAILVGFISLWAPGAWGYAETIVLFAAIIIGGAGNHKGAVLGAILVPLGFEEITRFLPPFGSPSLVPALEWVAIGLLIVLFLWFRPNGILPERRRILTKYLDHGPEVVSSSPKAGDDEDASLHLAPLGDFSFLRLPSAASANDQRPILVTDGLSKSFNGVQVVTNVSIAIQQGRLTGMIGPNGAGKSTTLAMLAGTLPSTSGRILYDGKDITSLPSYRRAQQGLVRTFQLASEFKKLTVLENLVCAVPRQAGDSFWGSVRGRRYWGQQDRDNIERAPRC